MIKIENALSYDETKERELLEKFHGGEKSALETLCEMNYKFINHIIYTNFNLAKRHHDDLFIEGFLGLREAISRWKPEKHEGFNSYKYQWIKKYMRVFLTKQNRYILADDYEEDEFANSLIELDSPVPPSQEKATNTKVLLADAIKTGILTNEEQIVLADLFAGYTHNEINKRRFGSQRLSHFHYTTAKGKLVDFSKGKKIKLPVRKILSKVKGKEGENITLKTNKGTFAGKYLRETNHFLILKNEDRSIRVPKEYIKSVTIVE